MALKDKFTSFSQLAQNAWNEFRKGNTGTISQALNLADSLIYNLNTAAGTYDRYNFGNADLMETMRTISVMDFWDFNTAMGMYMERLMRINAHEKQITLDTIGNDAHFLGDSDNITRDALKPKYIGEHRDLNYLDFMQRVKMHEPSGVTSTQQFDNSYEAFNSISPNDFNYGNLYPDDLDSGTFYNKWNTDNERNSILTKTKKLFQQKKINTIISRFGTNADGGSNNIIYNGSKQTKYGESRGRNLLKAGAQYDNEQYSVNGYNNPYCRVWTHHHQYKRYEDTMRPLWGKNLSVYHKLPNFQTDGYGEKVGWRNSGFAETRWERSVLDVGKGGGDGIIKITPKYANGGKTNVHTKDCMFSIENLAWKGYDPYQFENALSWEQRGPMGGRIMWFPPYGISFNETTNANWSATSFIGRGEKIYTYIDTERTGTLKFLMVVDHPSIIDYVSYGHEHNSTEINDTDVMRYFAGCDPQDENPEHSLIHQSYPTPLTDEYQAPIVEKEQQKAENEKDKTQPNTDPSDDETVTIEFAVYFPNNYSGVDDKAEHYDYAITYLLCGTSANKQDNGKNDIQYIDGTAFTFKNVGILPLHGYEIKESLSAAEDIKDYDKEGNYIKGGTNGSSKWYYRVDNAYVKQNLSAEQCKDEKYLGLNISPYKNDSNATQIYCSFIDIVYLMAKKEQYTNVCASIEEFVSKTEITIEEGEQPQTKNVIDYLEEIILGKEDDRTEQNKKLYVLDKIIATGVSSSHGYQELNEVLARNRAETVASWLIGFNLGVDSASEIKINSHQGDCEHKDVDDKEPKQYRAAIIQMIYKKNKTQPTSTNVEPKTVKNQAPSEGDTTASQSPRREGTESNQPTEVTPIQRAVNSVSIREWVASGIWHDLAAQEVSQIEDKLKWTFLNRHDFFNLSEAPAMIEALENARTKALEAAEQSHINSEGDAVEEYARLAASYEQRAKDVQMWIDMSKEKQNPDNDSGALKDVGLVRSASALNELQESGSTTVNGEKKNVSRTRENEKNLYRYDQEYHFFKALERHDKITYEKLMDKIKYFDPAFHSMTPEGFNARLTFLQQCTRQGNTVSATDAYGQSASNLAFGRPPFCVLRIGDFYNQMIVIDNINIDYGVSDGIQWDLNAEGIGMQPLLAEVSISFKFIGGGDLTGPIRRLQNAMSFNYYANTGLYDNRADIRGSDTNYETGIDVLNTNSSYAYLTPMANNNN